MSKKRINSSQKGGRFERKIANQFSDLFSDTFKRVPRSGAFVGGQNREKMMTLRSDAQEILAGDIIVPKWFPFSVECKSYGVATAPNMYTILNAHDAVLDEWLRQAKEDAEFCKKEFLIIFNITRRATYVCVDYHTFVDKCIESIDDLPEMFIMYKGSIIIDYDTFINTYIQKYFPKKESKNN